jgi:RimJ/RimL family protein N-acetyltransferase
VSLGSYDFNPRARRVYEKCGVVHEGRLRDALLWDGRWHDELRMSVLSTDRHPAP